MLQMFPFECFIIRKKAQTVAAALGLKVHGDFDAKTF